MALSGWNKVIEQNGNVYYHNKHTGEMRFSPPPTVPDNVPLKKATKMASFTKVRDAEGRLARGYPIGEDHYVTAKRFEGVKYIIVGKYFKPSAKRKFRSSVFPAIALDEDLWEELCKYKHIITELASHSNVSVNDGTDQACISHPEKFRLALGKGKYIRVLVKDGEVIVDIRQYKDILQRYIQDHNGKRATDLLLPNLENQTGELCQQGVIPDICGTDLPLEQWKNMTSLEGLIAVEHLKSLINFPLCPRKRPRSPSSSPPPSLAKRRKLNLKLKLALQEAKMDTVDKKEGKETPATQVKDANNNDDEEFSQVY